MTKRNHRERMRTASSASFTIHAALPPARSSCASNDRAWSPTRPRPLSMCTSNARPPRSCCRSDRAGYRPGFRTIQVCQRTFPGFCGSLTMPPTDQRHHGGEPDVGSGAADVSCPAWRRGCVLRFLADGGARATGQSRSHRLPRSGVLVQSCTSRCGVARRTPRSRLDRRSQSSHRVSLGGGQLRPVAGIGR